METNMKKVFIVQTHSGEDYEAEFKIVKVFSTQEVADKFVHEMNEMWEKISHIEYKSSFTKEMQDFLAKYASDNYGFHIYKVDGSVSCNVPYYSVTESDVESSF